MLTCVDGLPPRLDSWAAVLQAAAAQLQQPPLLPPQLVHPQPQAGGTSGVWLAAAGSWLEPGSNDEDEDAGQAGWQTGSVQRVG